MNTRMNKWLSRSLSAKLIFTLLPIALQLFRSRYAFERK